MTSANTSPLSSHDFKASCCKLSKLFRPSASQFCFFPAHSRNSISAACCHFFAAIDYSLFGDKEETNRRLSEYLQSMRDAEPAEGQSRVYVHGDKEADAEKDVLAHGVGINPATYAEIEKYCVKKGINIKDYLIPEEA